jgi:hypothetical protein
MVITTVQKVIAQQAAVVVALPRHGKLQLYLF